MSEWLERRERRRKWVILGLCVAVPLFLMGAGVVAIELHRQGGLPGLGDIKRLVSSGESKIPEVQPDELEPVRVKSFYDGQIKFTMLDANGFPTTRIFFFKEAPLEFERAEGEEGLKKGFVVIPRTEHRGEVEVYRLLDMGQAVEYKFEGVPARKVDETAGWTIPAEGWKQIRDELQARLNVSLGPANLE